MNDSVYEIDVICRSKNQDFVRFDGPVFSNFSLLRGLIKFLILI